MPSVLSRFIVLIAAAVIQVNHARSDDAALANAAPSTNDWPEFLGPGGNGAVDATDLITKWSSDGPTKLWSKDIGAGYSAPSILGDRLVVFHRVKNEERIDCLNPATGAQIWSTSYPSSFRDPYGYNNGPRCSPLLRGDRCYTFGAEGVLRCSSLENGDTIWERNTHDEFEVPEAFFGVGATPILVDDILVVPVGGQPNACLVGMNANTGETLWSSVGKQTWDGVETGWRRESNYEWTGAEMVISYSSPIAATFYGKQHVLCLSRQGLVSVDPQSGHENFKYWFRSEKHESVNAARPLVVGNRILISSTYGCGAAFLEVQPDGTSFKEIWRTEGTFETHWSTAVYKDGYFYGFSGRHEPTATMVCINATNGEVRWSTSGWEQPLDGLRQNGLGQAIDGATGDVIPWPFYGRGSATLAGDVLYVLGERGTLATVRATPDAWTETSRSIAPEMTYPAWPSPVIAQGRMYLRDEDSLVCLDLTSNTQQPAAGQP